MGKILSMLVLVLFLENIALANTDVKSDFNQIFSSQPSENKANFLSAHEMKNTNGEHIKLIVQIGSKTYQGVIYGGKLIIKKGKRFVYVTRRQMSRTSIYVENVKQKVYNIMR